jgi:hypothetical protein
MFKTGKAQETLTILRGDLGFEGILDVSITAKPSFCFDWAPPATTHDPFVENEVRPFTNGGRTMGSIRISSTTTTTTTTNNKGGDLLLFSIRRWRRFQRGHIRRIRRSLRRSQRIRRSLSRCRGDQGTHFIEYAIKSRPNPSIDV